MATLVCRPGDPQALKGASVAAAAEAPLAVLPLGESGAWKKLLADSADPAAARQLFLVLPDGGVLAEPNAIARYLGARLPAAASLFTSCHAAMPTARSRASPRPPTRLPRASSQPCMGRSAAAMPPPAAHAPMHASLHRPPA